MGVLELWLKTRIIMWKIHDSFSSFHFGDTQANFFSFNFWN